MSKQDALLAGDLVLARGIIWEIIDDDLDNIELSKGIALVDGHYERSGTIISYAVRGWERPTYDQLTPDEIETIWRMDRDT